MYIIYTKYFKKSRPMLFPKSEYEYYVVTSIVKTQFKKDGVIDGRSISSFLISF